VPLTPKSFDLLVVLVENSGHLIEKDELLKRIWPDSFVEEANLAVNISVLRKALGLSPSGGRSRPRRVLFPGPAGGRDRPPAARVGDRWSPGTRFVAYP